LPAALLRYRDCVESSAGPIDDWCSRDAYNGGDWTSGATSLRSVDRRRSRRHQALLPERRFGPGIRLKFIDRVSFRGNVNCLMLTNARKRHISDIKRLCERLLIQRIGKKFSKRVLIDV